MSTAKPQAPGVGLIRNSGWNLLGQVVPVLAALAAMPIVVRGLGPTRFGILALAWTVVGYMSQFDLGFGRAAVKRVSELRWSGDHDRIARVSWTVAGTQIALGVVTGLALLAAAPSIARVMTTDDASVSPEAARVLTILALTMPAVLASNAYRALLEGLQRFDLVNAARAPLSAAVFIIPMIGVLLGWSLVTIVAVLAVSRGIGALLYYVLYTRSAPPARLVFDRHELAGLFRYGGWIALSNVLVPLVIYLERLVVSGVHGARALAFYAAPQELVTRLLLVPSAVGAALFPAFSGLSGRGDDAQVIGAMMRGTRLIAVLLAPACAIIIILAEPILTIFFGRDYGLRSVPVMQILAGAVFLNGLVFIPVALVEARGKPEVVAKYHLAELPVYAAVLWLLVGRYGVTGAAAAWAIRMLWTTPLFYAVAMSAAGIDPREPLRERTGHAALAGILLIAGVALLDRTVPGEWLPLALGVALVCLFIVLVWPLLLSEDDRAAARTVYVRLRT